MSLNVCFPPIAVTSVFVQLRQMLVRSEEQRDIEGIAEIIKAAFRNAEHSSGTEAEVVNALRGDNALTVSLVATDQDSIIGHVAMSPVSIGNKAGWCGLGPVSVRPDWQRKSIGSRLIEEALAQLKDLGAAGCVVLGEPKFYGKFGFAHDPNVTYADVPPPYFQILSFGSERPTGAVLYHPAFRE